MILNKIALILVIVGALNWGGIGLFGFDTAPVQSTHNYQNQCNLIKNHDRPPFLFEINLIMSDFSESIHGSKKRDNFLNAIERKGALLYNNVNS